MCSMAISWAVFDWNPQFSETVEMSHSDGYIFENNNFTSIHKTQKLF